MSREVPIERRGGLPAWALIAMIAAPLAGIIVVLALKTAGPASEDGSAKRADPNTRLLELEKQIADFEREFGEIQRLRQAEDPAVKGRADALVQQIDEWTLQWDSILEPLRDQESGALPFEYQGYQQTRARVSRIVGDLAKTGGFFE